MCKFRSVTVDGTTLVGKIEIYPRSILEICMKVAHTNQTQKTPWHFLFVFPYIVGNKLKIPTCKVLLNQITSYLKRYVYVLDCGTHGAVLGKIQVPAMLQWLPRVWLETGRERSLQMDAAEWVVTRQAEGWSPLRQLWRRNGKRRARGQNQNWYMIAFVSEWGEAWELRSKSKANP